MKKFNTLLLIFIILSLYENQGQVLSNHGDKNISDSHESFTDRGSRPYQDLINLNIPDANSNTYLNIALGNLLYVKNYINIPGLIPLRLIFTYNSGSFFRGRYGYGWQMNYNVRYVSNSINSSVIIVRPDDRTDIFEKQKNDEYKALYGVRDSLICLAKGYKLIVWNDNFNSNYDYLEYFFESPDHHYLTRIVDRNKNTMIFTYNQDKQLIKVTDPVGRELNFNYTNNYLVNVIDPAKREFKFEYDNNGDMVKYTDPLGNSTKYAYSKDCHDLLSITNSNNNEYKFSYNSDFAVESVDYPGLKNAFHVNYNFADGENEISDGNGNITVYYVDKKDRVYKIKDPLNNFMTVEWDDDYLIKSITDKKDNKTEFTYDFKGNLLNTKDPLGNENKYEWDYTYNKVKRVTNANNSFTIFDYDSKGNLINVKDALNNIESHIYDNSGLLIKSVNPIDAVTNFHFDNFGNLTKIIDDENNSQTFSYDVLGNIQSHVDAKGYSTTYIYDILNRLQSFTNPLSNKISFNYNSIGNIVKQTDARGYTVFYNYNIRDLIVKYINSLDDSVIFSYDKVGNRTSLINENGNMTTFHYDILNRIDKITDALNNQTEYKYDESGNRTSITDANGNTTTYHYDALNRLINTADALNQIKSYSYDIIGNKTSETDAKGNTYTYQYNLLNQLILSTCPIGCTTNYTYDAAGKVVSVIDPLSRKILFEYNMLGQLIKTTNPYGNFSSKKYDANGNIVSVTDEDGNETIYNYDSINKLISVTSPLGFKQEYSYDDSGNLTSIKDENKSITKYEYDAQNRIVKIIEPLNTQKSFEYDAVGNKVKETDQMGNISVYEYDKINRNIKVTSPMNHINIFKYDGISNLIEKIDPNGNTVKYTFDKLNRNVLTSYPDATQVSWEYDAADNPIKITNTGGLKEIINRTYDQNNRMVSESINFGKFTKTVTYNYDAAGNILSLTDPDGKTISYEYNSIDRLTKITDQNGKVTSNSYYPTGKIKDIRYPDRLFTSYEFDKNKRTSKIITVDSLNIPLFQYDYNYDPAGRIISAQKNGINEGSYQFDDNKLVLANYPNSSNKYTYNLAGKRISKDENNNITTYSNNQENRVTLQTFPDGRTISYEYDKNGNVIKTTSSWGVVNYEYDYENRLSRVSYPPPYGTLAYYYSPENIQLAKKRNDTIIYYFPSLMGTIAELDAQGNTLTRFNPGISFEKNDDTFILSDKQSTYYSHWDINNSSVFFSGNSITASFIFDYFGGMAEQSGNTGTVEPGLYSNGQKVNWDESLGAEFIGISYAPDIAQDFSVGGPNIGPVPPAIPWGWNDGGGVDNKNIKVDIAQAQKLREELDKLRSDLIKLKKLLNDLLKQANNPKKGTCSCTCKPKIDKVEHEMWPPHAELQKSYLHASIKEGNSVYDCTPKPPCSVAKVTKSRSAVVNYPSGKTGTYGEDPKWGGIWIPEGNLQNPLKKFFSSIDFYLSATVTCNDGTECRGYDVKTLKPGGN